MTCPDPHNVQTFYDDLAAEYTLLFADWRASVQRQGDVLAALIRQHGGAEVRAILDAACGIGTQAIGLARYLIPGSLGCCQTAVARYFAVTLHQGAYSVEHRAIPYDDGSLWEAYLARQVWDRNAINRYFFGSRFAL